MRKIEIAFWYFCVGDPTILHKECNLWPSQPSCNSFTDHDLYWLIIEYLKTSVVFCKAVDKMQKGLEVTFHLYTDPTLQSI